MKKKSANPDFYKIINEKYNHKIYFFCPEHFINTALDRLKI